MTVDNRLWGLQCRIWGTTGSIIAPPLPPCLTETKNKRANEAFYGVIQNMVRPIESQVIEELKEGTTVDGL